MITHNLQPQFARHLMGFPQTDFGSLVQALYGIEDGIARGLWVDSSLSEPGLGLDHQMLVLLVWAIGLHDALGFRDNF